MNKKVGIVVLNYKNYEDTIACLRSLAEITYQNTEIIVVDNDSQNDSLEYICQDLMSRQVPYCVVVEGSIDTNNCSASKKIILLQSNCNRGYAAGNNLGIRLALERNADYILILNNDTIVKNGFMEPLIHYAEDHDNVGIVGPKVIGPDGKIQLVCARRRYTPICLFFVEGIGNRLFKNSYWKRKHTYTGEYFFDYPREVDVLSGCCMLVKSSTFYKIGLLDENTFLYAEEFIIHEKLLNIGLKCFIVPISVIVHKQGQSTAKISSHQNNKSWNASIRYYFTQYRHYNRFTVALILLSCWTPKKYLRSLLK